MFMKVCKQHHDEVAAGNSMNHVTDTVIGIEELFKFAAIPGCVLQPVQGNPARADHGLGCINVKRRFYEFGLNPAEPYTTSNQCNMQWSRCNDECCTTPTSNQNDMQWSMDRRGSLLGQTVFFHNVFVMIMVNLKVINVQDNK